MQAAAGEGCGKEGVVNLCLPIWVVVLAGFSLSFYFKMDKNKAAETSAQNKWKLVRTRHIYHAYKEWGGE